MSFTETELTRDAFLDGRLHLRQPKRGYRAAIDPVLLAAFTPARPGARVLDLGCGAGAAALCLAARAPGLELHGLELQADYADLARRNAAENALPLQVHEGDLRQLPAGLRTGFDVVMANPPFHMIESAPSPDPGRDRSLREDATLSEWIAAGLRRLKPGGRLVLIHHVVRLDDILVALHHRAGGVDILPVSPRAGRPATRVLVRARKLWAGSLTLWPPLTLHEGSSHTRDAETYTAEAQKVLRGMAELLPDARSGGITSP